MKKYLVVALAVNSALSNKVFESGDEVTEDMFPEGDADSLVESGHLKFIGEVEKQPENSDSLDDSEGKDKEADEVDNDVEDSKEIEPKKSTSTKKK